MSTSRKGLSPLELAGLHGYLLGVLFHATHGECHKVNHSLISLVKGLQQRTGLSSEKQLALWPKDDIDAVPSYEF